MKHKFFMAVFLVLFASSGICQDPGDDNNSHLLPDVIPPSPTAASLGTYGDMSIGMFTGTISPNVPIYEVKSGSLTLPINLSYFSTGTKVDQVASWVGTGWSLNCGGVISRIMKGKPDEAPTGYWQMYTEVIGYNDPNLVFDPTPYLDSNADPDKARRIAEGNNEYQPDIFTYNFNGMSGKFFIDPGSKTVYTIPYSDLLIEYDDLNLTWFKATTSTGVQYFFENVETTTSETVVSNSPNSSQPEVFNSSWYLSRIVSADEIDEITIEYKQNVINQPVSRSETDYYPSTANSQCPSKSKEVKISLTTVDVLYPERIISRNEEVILNSSKTRLDLLQDYKLDDIEVLRNNILISKVALTYNYFTPNHASSGYFTGVNTNGIDPAQRLRLDRVDFLGDGTGQDNFYEFTYDATPVPYMGSYAVDSWGYYNGKTGNTSLLKETTVNGSTWAGADKSADPNFARAGILTKIKYPTKGSSEYVYEGNLDESGNPVGGLRIAQIKNFDHSGNSNQLLRTRYFSYSNGVTQEVPTYLYDSHNYVIENNTVTNNGTTYQLPVIVGECWYTTRTSSANADMTYSAGSTVGYPEVTELSGPNGEFGKKVYYYNTSKDPRVLLPPYPYRSDKSYQRGLLEKEETYLAHNQSGTITHTLQAEKVVTYNDFKNTDPEAVLRGVQITFRKKSPYINSPSTEYYVEPYVMTSQWVYPIREVTTNYDDPVHPFITMTSYSYKGDNHIYPVRTETVNSDGRTHISQVKYPTDYLESLPVGNTSDITFQDLIDLNMISMPIETQSWYGENGTEFITNSSVTSFEDVANPGAQAKVIRPNEVSLLEILNPIAAASFSQPTNPDGKFSSFFPSSSNYVEKVDYIYDPVNGLRWEERIVDGITSSYLWDEERFLPVAKCINAERAEFAYTSFERENPTSYSGDPTNPNNVSNVFVDGGWEIVRNAAGGWVTNEDQLKTGLRGFHIQPENYRFLRLQGLPAGEYVVSFWYQGGEIELSSSTQATQSTFVANQTPPNAMTYKEFQITGGAPISLELHAALGNWNTFIDEVRIHPVDAQMSTICYDEALRIHTMTDINNSPSYYIYDEFGRLEFVRDWEGNFVQRLEYNYKD
ncbi:MAG: hypothetical protein MRZ79_07965 [Bacteroidia bacterium]|nr:hypothetical protein [Bacteroidia bacterium]